MALTKHTLLVLSNPEVKLRSFTLTPTGLSLTISREVSTVESTTTVGLDRNLRNLTCGNEERVIQYDVSQSVRVAKITRKIVASFKRDDTRITRIIASKYGRRRMAKTKHLLHLATKKIVMNALNCRETIVMEDIRGVRRLYRGRDGHGRAYRAMMNAWSFSEVQRQIEYKARWAGLPVIRLTRRETRGTSTTCPRCGERLQSDKRLKRKLWCEKCRWLLDRDVAAAINIARRGRLRFDRSLPTAQAKGEAYEAMKGNPPPTAIPGVDASKPRST